MSVQEPVIMCAMMQALHEVDLKGDCETHQFMCVLHFFGKRKEKERKAVRPAKGLRASGGRAKID